MNLTTQELELIDTWLRDPSFSNWAAGANEQDTVKWEQYFQAHPEHLELGKISRNLVIGIPFRAMPRNEANKQQALSRLMQQLEESSARHQVTGKVRKLTRVRYVQGAAAITLLVLATTLLYFQFLYNPKVLIATDFGQRLEHYLPDGSQVTLNANSTLTYRTRNPREVWLNGEAFFEVKKVPETKAKFNVWTTDLSVTVLGTAFNVNTRNEQTQVFLKEGKVQLELETRTAQVIEMDPGDLIVYSKKKQQLSEKKKNASLLESASWKEGSLMFKDTPLPEALDAIAAIYGVQFIIESDNLQQKVISGGVPIQNLEVTLVTLSEIYGLDIRKEGNNYYLNGITEAQ
ncbi:MAG: FecR domain-containing protein [Saprospiraceae bacterium]|jgi:transmembrane sensor|nr:FecR domain-containing protein [Saprospiraceae bacterium]MDP4998187.1 FecR domain-containing protein [Saprospiraceae bacterium]